MNFGLVLGGAAQGYAQGIKDAQAQLDAQRNAEVIQGQRESEAIMRAIPTPDTPVPASWTPDQVINQALQDAKPKPDLIQRAISAVAQRLNPGQAALASGVTPPPPPPNPDGTPAVNPTASTSGGLPAPPPAPPANVDAVTVQAQPPAPISDLQRAHMMLAAASRLRGPNAQEAVQNAWQHVHDLETQQAGDEITASAFRGPDALANTVSRMSRHDVQIDPVQGRPGMFMATVDGQPSGQPMTMAQMTDQAIALAKHDPSYALDAGLRRSADQRSTADVQSQITYRNAQAATDRMRAAAEATLQRQQGALVQTQTQQGQLDLAQTQKDYDALGRAQTLMSQDAFLNGDQLHQAAAQIGVSPNARKFGVIQDNQVLDTKTGQYHTVQTNKLDEQIKAAEVADRNRYNASPFVQKGVIGISAPVSQPDGTVQRFYQVKGVDGMFPNINAAEIAARSKYPNIEDQVRAEALKKAQGK